ncbi:cupin domain-containing protein [Cognatilysobacter lacus]|uniref:Cupin domain-containing protein n=1 Tax=Cognatilysobacter lacus TaxID=1643323 RepID=A0A5D8Z714_9GAMM|nr:cupin domain-containing protein [Lysobacter lacus]TZF90467.1 cupin domain-containing protein [Lysobacter lacus]
MTPKGDAIDLSAKLAAFGEQWSPRVVAEMNDVQFKVVKLEGDFVWHSHDETDETFIVLKGELRVGYRDSEVTLREGEMIVIPRGVEHITRAASECHALIIEPRGVVNTGDAHSHLTATNDVWV